MINVFHNRVSIQLRYFTCTVETGFLSFLCRRNDECTVVHCLLVSLYIAYFYRSMLSACIVVHCLLVPLYAVCFYRSMLCACIIVHCLLVSLYTVCLYRVWCVLVQLYILCLYRCILEDF